MYKVTNDFFKHNITKKRFLFIFVTLNLIFKGTFRIGRLVCGNHSILTLCNLRQAVNKFLDHFIEVTTRNDNKQKKQKVSESVQSNPTTPN